MFISRRCRGRIGKIKLVSEAAQRIHPQAGRTRHNPKVRYFANLNEKISVAKSFVFRGQVRLDFRAEALNAFNRVRFGTGSSTLQPHAFCILSSNGDLLNTPRQVQFALKLYF